MLIFAIFQVVFFSRAQLAAQDGASSGARAAAVAANDRLADRDILASVKRAASSLPSDGVIKVIVFKASGPNSAVPTACLSGAQDGLCNVYTAADLARPDSDYGSASWGGDNHWPASSRNVSRGAGTDYVGVNVQTSCSCAGAVVLPKVLSRTGIQRLEAGSA